MFGGLCVDLSRHAVTITQYLTPHLLSKDDMCRQPAVNALAILGTQMSDAVAVKAMIDQLSGILKGNALANLECVCVCVWISCKIALEGFLTSHF